MVCRWDNAIKFFLSFSLCPIFFSQDWHQTLNSAIRVALLSESSELLCGNFIHGPQDSQAAVSQGSSNQAASCGSIGLLVASLLQVCLPSKGWNCWSIKATSTPRDCVNRGGGGSWTASWRRRDPGLGCIAAQQRCRPSGRAGGPLPEGCTEARTCRTPAAARAQSTRAPSAPGQQMWRNTDVMFSFCVTNSLPSNLGCCVKCK